MDARKSWEPFLKMKIKKPGTNGKTGLGKHGLTHGRDLPYQPENIHNMPIIQGNGIASRLLMNMTFSS